MKGIYSWPFRSIFSFLSVMALFLVLFICRPGLSQVLMDFDQTQASTQLQWQEFLHFQSGVFEINYVGDNVLSKCIKTGGEWIRVNYQYQDCAVDNSGELINSIDRLKTERMSVGSFFLFRHFGIDGSPQTNYGDWNRINNSSNDSNFYGDIGTTIGFGASRSEIKWSIDTRNLPDRMRLEIPGAGIHAQFGRQFRVRDSYIFQGTNKCLRVDLNMKVSRYRFWGNGKANLTIGNAFQIEDINGDLVPLTLNVSLVNLPGITLVEGTGSDTRSLYARTNLGQGSTFINHINGAKFSGPTSSYSDYSYEICQANLLTLINQMNIRRDSQDLPLLKTNNFSSVRLKNIVLKNEISHLYSNGGDALVTFKVKKFKAEVESRP